MIHQMFMLAKAPRGDPYPTAWLITVAYFVAAGLCFWAGRREKQESIGRARRWRRNADPRDEIPGVRETSPDPVTITSGATAACVTISPWHHHFQRPFGVEPHKIGLCIRFHYL